MSRPIELPPPLSGLSENVARSDQEPGTTRELDNARTVDQTTGEIRLAQRAGTSQFVAGAVKATNTKVDLIRPVGYALDLINYTQLTDATSPAVRDEKTYLSSSKAEAFSPRTDSSGNVYFLDQSDTILVLTSDLTKIGQIVLPLQATDTVCRTIVVDDRNYVYAAASTPGSFNNGVVWRFSKRDDPVRWVQDWEFPVPSSVVRLTYSSGMLAVAQRERGGQKDRSSVTILNVISDAPVVAWTRSLPDPIRDVAFDRDNNVLITSPYNASRTLAADADNFQTTLIDWTWWDLTWTPATPTFNQRPWCGFDAELLEDFSWGDPVRKADDDRFDAFWSANVTSYDVVDDTDRFFHRLEFKGGEIWRPPPTYDVAAFGTKPGIAFDGSIGQILVSRPNNAGENKANTSAAMPKNKGAVPGVAGVKWALSFVVRITPGPDPMFVFGLREGPLKFAVVANADGTFDPAGSSGAPVGGAEGSIVLWTGPDAVSAGLGGTGGNTSAHDYMADPTGSANVNDVQCALVTIVHNGIGVGTGEFRVNGTSVDVFDWALDQQFSVQSNGARGMFGSPQILKGTLGATVTKTVTEQVFNADTGEYDTVTYETNDETVGAQANDPFGNAFVCGAFDGALAEYKVILGDSTNTTTHADISVSAAEIADLESYLAYKWGIQHLLDTGHPHVGAAQAGTAFTGTDDLATTLQKAFLTDDPITAKLSGSAGALMWAFNGPGMGLAVAGNQQGDVFTYGPRETGTDTAAGALSPIALKVIDEGTRVERGTASTGTLTYTGNVVNNDQVQIGDKTYTYRTVVSTANQVLVGGSTAASIENLEKAINLTGTAGTEYGTGTEKHHQVDATSTATTLVVSAVKRGSSEDSITTTDPTDAGGVMSWGAGTLSGGDAKNTWTVTAQHTDSSPDPPDNPPAAYAHTAGAGAAFQIAVDDEGDCYHTRNNTTGTNAGIYKYDKAGDATGNATLGTPWKWILGYANSPTIGKYTGIAFPPVHPDYGTQPITGPLFMYVTTEGPEGASAFGTPTADSTANLHKVRLVEEERNTSNDSVRGKRLVAVSGGDVKRFTKGGSYTSIGAGVLLASSPFVDGFTLYSKLYLFDSTTRAQVYDPRRDTIANWVADKGEVPERIYLGCAWRGRACVVASDRPHNIVMSKHGDPDDFDLYPEVPNYEQAISLDQVEAIGQFPDIIQCMFPIDSERLLVGGDSSTMLLVGDPAAVALGDFGKSFFSLISDEVGIAFGGQAATKDERGLIYWFGSRGGVFAWNGQGVPKEITEDRIQRKLADIDLSVWKPTLAWNDRQKELIVAMAHRTSGGVPQEEFSWCRRTGAWSTTTFARTTHQAACLAVLDGDDPADRHLVRGCEDGFIRVEDETRSDDDGQRIYSKVLLGPY
ncbi:MAG: hypothetical protein JSV86_12830, partial [Gemmatimonadota bacterium]